MEVEARSLASSFPYSLDKIDISRDFLPHDSPDMPSTGSDGVKSGGLHSPESGDRKCEEFEMPMLSDEDGMMDATGNSPVVQVEVEVEEEVSEGACSDKAAVKLQKVYRSYRTRRRLADSAVVAEELWWQAIDYARLNHSTISFFNFFKQETAVSRWNRVTLNASRVGKGLSKDDKALKLAFQHWIEAIDPRHRYGHNLHIYYEEWCKTNSGQPFFYWLDIGDGKELDLQECPRSKLRQQCVKYLGPQEREQYEYIVAEGKITHKQTGILLDTSNGPMGAKWIFVMSTSKRLYAGEKKKGIFHHSSFLAGGVTLAAGRLTVENGTLKINKASEDSDVYDDGKFSTSETMIEVLSRSEPPKLDILNEERDSTSEPSEVAQTKSRGEYTRTLSGGLQSPRAEVPKNAILHRINSKKAAKSYQLGHQLSLKWSTGAGPRIGCVADYPVEVRLQALEFVNLSPRRSPTPSSYRQIAGLASPTAQFTIGIPNGDGTSYI
ncbi:hypothetical protein MANES_09G059000v8 [Manihot esculenta]|uniref:Uncharacterized protein n=1 Tax=Manihot esculenta TaxID=3983 RepID=A0ACB7H5X5_MANES|nr:hypothetical protein MANES_09G059000v8 [Manihot esculenta]